MTLKTTFVSVILLATPFVTAHAQPDDTMNDVRLMGSFFEDTAEPSELQVEGVLTFGDFDHANQNLAGVQANIPLQQQIDVGAAIAYSSVNYEVGKDVSGLSALQLYGRYHLPRNNLPMKVSLGSMLSLPMGEKDVGGDRFDFGAFAALRYPVQDNMVLTGNAGLYSLDLQDREITFHLSGGILFHLQEKINLIGEFTVKTEEDFVALLGGVDYSLAPNMSLRPSLLIGLDDGAPDLGISVGLLLKY